MEYSSLISYKQLSRKLQNKCSLVVKWKSSLRTFYGRLLGLVTRNGISLLYMTMAISKLSLSKSGPSVLVHDLSQNMTLGFLTSVIRIPLVGQELNILPEYPSSSPISVVYSIVCLFLIFVLTLHCLSDLRLLISHVVSATFCYGTDVDINNLYMHRSTFRAILALNKL
jgi:hypothetical protein